jgi:hypothetical protein
VLGRTNITAAAAVLEILRERSTDHRIQHCTMQHADRALLELKLGVGFLHVLMVT